MSLRGLRRKIAQPPSISPEQLGLKALFAPETREPTVDIVAVHGIGANPDYTWTTSGVNWLEDPRMLPEALPNARILRFGYNSQWFGDNAIKQRLSNVAESLLHALRSERQECQRRPIVFVGHCFGGLVIQKALTTAKMLEHQWPNLFDSAAGVVFLGTPHRGTGSVTSKGLVYAGIASNPSLQVDDTVLRALIYGNDILMDVFHEFMSLSHAPGADISLCCFFEQRSTKVGRIIGRDHLEEFVVDEISGCIDGHPKYGLPLDHFRLNKFSSPDDGNYRAVRDEIQRLAEKAIRKLIPSPVTLSDVETKCLQSLYKLDYRQHKEINTNREAGTCEWFLRHQKFRDWLESKISSLLWVSADPGCGKSVLCKSLVDNELASSDSYSTCYFFFKDDDPEHTKATNALCSLLHQLFSQKPTLLKYAIPEFENTGAVPKSVGTLWNILKNTAAERNVGDVICVLDALDECTEPERIELIRTLCDFYDRASNLVDRNTRLKFLVTSRPYAGIEAQFRKWLGNGLPTIRLAGENETELELISHEIDLVIKARVRDLERAWNLDGSLRSVIEREILRITHRTYLWVKLIFDVIDRRLSSTKNENRIIKLIGTIPSTVDEAYEAILNKIEPEEKPRAKKLLRIIVAAKRPLTLREMNVALAMEEGTRSYEDLDLEPEQSFKTIVRNLCGLFVTVVDSKIYLIHQTAKEYLILKTDATQSVSHVDSYQGIWKHSLELGESNLVLAQICISYLLFPIFESHPLVVGPDVPRTRIQETVDQYAERHDLLDYAAKHWPAHFREAHIRGETPLLESTLCLFNTQSNRFLTWFRVFWIAIDPYSKFPRGFTGLIAASYFGLEGVVRRLLRDMAKVNDKDYAGRTALSWAALKEHKPVVRLLLEAKADVNAKDNYGQAALHRAVQYGHTSVVQRLLEAKADVNAKDKNGWTALHLAAAEPGHGYNAVMQRLLEAKADVNAKDNDGRTALHLAAQRGHGHDPVMQQLLEAKADVNAKDNDGRTALHLAARRGHGYNLVVQRLLEAKADVNAKDNDGRTALHLAAQRERGYDPVVQQLLEAKADVNVKDNEGRTALHLAAQRGHGRDPVVERLLEAKADVNSKDNGGRTALHLAAQYGYEWVVLKLLGTKPEMDAKDNYGQTALDRALQYGHYEVVSLLQNYSTR